MSIAPGWADLSHHQRADGSFSAAAQLSSGLVEEGNAFVTALVLDALNRAPESGLRTSMIERGLNYLERCEDVTSPGRFGFYADGSRPEWIPPLPFDVDDSALALTQLVRHGRTGIVEVKHALDAHLRRFRLEFVSERSEPWHQVGVFETWLDTQMIRNPVDCTVNANVATLLAACGIDAPETEAIVAMTIRAIDWADGSRDRARVVSPWYPEPIEWFYAVERAERAGVPGMDACAAELRRQDWVRRDSEQDLPVCGSSDRRIVWTCPALHLARSLTHSLISSEVRC